MLCKFTAFWGTLHWPAGADDTGHFGISFPEVLILVGAIGLDTGWSAKRLPGLMFVQTDLFQFLLCLFQKESKLGRDVS